MDVEVIAISLALLVNFGGLVWGAAKMNETIKTLCREIERLRKTVREIQDIQIRVVTRVAVLEERTAN